MDDLDLKCQHGVAKRHGCRQCIAVERMMLSYDKPGYDGNDTGEIPMTAAEYTAWREHVHSTLRTPGWESPELRALREDE